MANFGVFQPTEVRGGWLENFTRGYQIGKDIKGRYTQKKFAEALAESPEEAAVVEQQEAIPTEGTPAPAPARGVGGEPAQPHEYGERAGSTETPQQAVPMEEGTTKEVPAKKIKTRDWAAYRKKLMDMAAKTGDPNAVTMASKHVTGMQHKGFMQNAGLAQQYLSAGHPEAAIKYLEEAHQYIPDMEHAEFEVNGDKILMSTTNEETGKPGTLAVVTPQFLNKLVANFADPEKFAYWNYESMLRQQERKEDQAIDTDRFNQEMRLKRERLDADAAHRQGITDRDTRRLEMAEAEAARRAERDAIMDPLRQDSERALAEQRRASAARSLSPRTGGTGGLTKHQLNQARRQQLDLIAGMEAEKQTGLWDPEREATLAAAREDYRTLQAMKPDEQPSAIQLPGAAARGPGQRVAADAIDAGGRYKAPRVGDVEDGHRFVGTDPGNPAHWEKI